MPRYINEKWSDGSHSLNTRTKRESRIPRRRKFQRCVPSGAISSYRARRLAAAAGVFGGKNSKEKNLLPFSIFCLMRCIRGMYVGAFRSIGVRGLPTRPNDGGRLDVSQELPDPGESNSAEELAQLVSNESPELLTTMADLLGRSQSRNTGGKYSHQTKATDKSSPRNAKFRLLKAPMLLWYTRGLGSEVNKSQRHPVRPIKSQVLRCRCCE